MNEYGVTERKRTWDSFLDMGSNTRIVYFVHYTEELPERPPLWPEMRNERIEWAWETYSKHTEQIEWLNDDRIPYLSCVTGTELFAEAFGCKVHRPPESNPCALPLIHDSRSVADLKVPSLDSAPLAVAFEIADELYKRSGGSALVGLPDIQSPMDIAALIWDKNSFYIAMLEEPLAVQDLSAMVFELLTAFLDEWFSRYGTEYIAHFPSYFMRGGMTLSEDEIGAVGERQFCDFFFDELSLLSERYGGIGIHCCAHAVHQWKNLKRIPGLKLLNLSIEPEKAYRYFENDVAQWHPIPGEKTPLEKIDGLPPNAHAVIQVDAESREDALYLADELWAATGRS